MNRLLPIALMTFLAAQAAAQSTLLAWDGGETELLRLGPPDGSPGRQPEWVGVAGGRGLCFDAEEAEVATFAPDVVPSIEGAATLTVQIRLDRLPREKAGLVGRWKLAEGGRSFELGVFPSGHLFFTASASGGWPREAREIRSPEPIPLGELVEVGFAFAPAESMQLLVNGEVVRATGLGVPSRLFPAELPIHLGCRAGGEHHAFSGIVAGLRIVEGTQPTTSSPPAPPWKLDELRQATRRWYETLEVEGRPYGAYALRPGQEPDLYAAADLAWIRWMTSDLELTDGERGEWLDFIASCQRDDGGFRHGTGHCPTHAFCHATGAVKMLGGSHRRAPLLLEPYREIGRIPEWLDGLRWDRPWGASHDIWGAGLPIACSNETPDEWREAFFAWCDREVDPATGYWRRGVPVARALAGLGGAFHIWPIYAAMDRDLPYPERIIDSTLSFQQADGSFDGGFGYGHMDALWVLAHLLERVEHRREEVRAALERATTGLMEMERYEGELFWSDAHGTLSRIASLAICYEVLPERFESAHPWRNPWSKRELFLISF